MSEILGEQINVTVQCPKCKGIIKTHTFSKTSLVYADGYCESCQMWLLGPIIERLSP